ncbi:MAG: AsnC family protein [Pseudomonadota bacterium]
MLDFIDKQLLTAIQGGLPLTTHPYKTIATQINQSEAMVIQRIKILQENGTIKRLGVVVKHRALGFKANAMVVWNIPDAQVKEIAKSLAAFECVTLCYQRPRRLPDWSYNLFTMIHGKNRDSVLERLSNIIEILDLQNIPYKPLFSTKQFKQRGGHYFKNSKVSTSRDNVIGFTQKQKNTITTAVKTEQSSPYPPFLKPLYG